MESDDPECSIEEHEKILKMPKDKHTDLEIKDILLKYKRVAVVGMSREEGLEYCHRPCSSASDPLP